jgi:hypothetical protein
MRRTLVLGVTAASLIALAVAGGGRLYAETNTAKAATETVSEQVSGGATPAADADMSEHGLAAMNDVHMARMAVNDGDVDNAKQLLKEAQTLLAKVKSENQPVTITTEVKVGDKPAKKETVSEKPDLIPILADMKVIEGMVAADNATNTKPKTAGSEGSAASGKDEATAKQAKAASAAAKVVAANTANEQLNKGDRNGAIETLKAADLGLVSEIVSMPLAQTSAHVDKALALIDKGQLHEANLELKQAKDELVVDTTVIVEPVNAAATNNPGKTGNSPQQAAHPANAG